MGPRARSAFAATALAPVLALAASCRDAAARGAADVRGWLVGNLHAHTTHCDHADASPAEVVRWYHDHGYDFLCLSEHDLFLEPAELELGFQPRAGFFLIRGAEVNYPDIRYTLVNHVRMSSLGGARFEARPSAGSRAGQLQEMVRDVHLGGGVPVLNHPTYLAGVGPDDVSALEGLHLFEVWNGAWQEVWPVGAESMSAEQLWDRWLTAGKMMYAVAADDAHLYAPGRPRQTPGRAWVVVGAAERSPAAVLDALLAGEFYASTGVVLSALQRGPDECAVEVDEPATTRKLRAGLLAPSVSPTGRPGTRIEWIGPGGAVLAAVEGTSARIAIDPEHAYVRCRVTHTWPVERGFAICHAWTQPVFTGGRELPRRIRHPHRLTTPPAEPQEVR